MAANPEDTTRLAIDEELRTIEVKLRGTTHAQDIELVSRWAVRPDDLLQHLNALQPDIVHFSGHGTKQALMLAGDDGVARPVDAAKLTRVFGLFPGIRAVVLNACFSEVQARAIAAKVDCVIGMAIEVGDGAAHAFAGSFYRALGFGRSLREAFDQGTAAIELEGLGEQSTPQLVVRDPGGDWRLGAARPAGAEAAPARIEAPAPAAAAAPEPGRRTVFVAYAPADRPWLERLQVHLKPHLKGKAIDLWETGKVQAGTRMREAQAQALAAAEVAILLVSADFLGSEDLVDEQLPRLLAAADGRGLAILPLVVGACAYAECPLGPYMALNEPGRPLDELSRPEQNRELVRIARSIDEVLRARFGG